MCVYKHANIQYVCMHGKTSLYTNTGLKIIGTSNYLKACPELNNSTRVHPVMCRKVKDTCRHMQKHHYIIWFGHVDVSLHFRKKRISVSYGSKQLLWFSRAAWKYVLIPD